MWIFFFVNSLSKRVKTETQKICYCVFIVFYNILVVLNSNASKWSVSSSHSKIGTNDNYTPLYVSRLEEFTEDIQEFPYDCDVPLVCLLLVLGAIFVDLFTVLPFYETLKLYEMLCAIWYHLRNFRIVRNTNRGVSRLLQLQASIWNVTKSNTPPPLYKWYRIAQSITYENDKTKGTSNKKAK